MIVRIIFLITALLALSCAQSTHRITAIWDKNTEPDMKYYDLFLVERADSGSFFTDDTDIWPNKMSDHVALLDTHYTAGYLQTVAHVFSPVDSLWTEWDQAANNKWIRAYIIAADSLNYKSAISPSFNVLFMENLPPGKPKPFRFQR